MLLFAKVTAMHPPPHSSLVVLRFGKVGDQKAPGIARGRDLDCCYGDKQQMDLAHVRVQAWKGPPCRLIEKEGAPVAAAQTRIGRRGRTGFESIASLDAKRSRASARTVSNQSNGLEIVSRFFEFCDYLERLPSSVEEGRSSR